MLKGAILAIFMLNVAITVLAQSGGPFAITQSVIAGGGASSSGSDANGEFSLTGTIAEPVAGTTSTGSSFGLNGGFWNFSFAPTSASVSVSGRVTRSNGVRVSRARVVFAAPNGSLQSALTNSFGIFVLDGLEAGNTYVVSVEKKGLSFAPIALLITEDINGLELVMLD